jgi:nucleoid-associated protein YgaU
MKIRFITFLSIVSLSCLALVASNCASNDSEEDLNEPLAEGDLILDEDLMAESDDVSSEGLEQGAEDVGEDLTDSLPEGMETVADQESATEDVALVDAEVSQSDEAESEGAPTLVDEQAQAVAQMDSDESEPLAQESEAAEVASSSLSEEIKYTIKSGDTLSQIASDLLNDQKRWRELADLNKIANPDLIFPGQVLRVIKGESYARSDSSQNVLVKRGDSLSSIAESHLGSRDLWRQIWQANRDKISNPDKIAQGMTLVVKTKSSKETAH